MVLKGLPRGQEGKIKSFSISSLITSDGSFETKEIKWIIRSNHILLTILNRISQKFKSNYTAETQIWKENQQSIKGVSIWCPCPLLDPLCALMIWGGDYSRVPPAVFYQPLNYHLSPIICLPTHPSITCLPTYLPPHPSTSSLSLSLSIFQCQCTNALKK